MQEIPAAFQAAEFLLTEDRGSQAPKRWQQMKKLPVKARFSGRFIDA